MSRIFICYRREDSIAYAGRIYDRLAAHFGEHDVFMDIDTLSPGVDFVKVLNQTVSSCDVLLAIIGRGWAKSTNREGKRRLFDPDDYVRVEIRSALEREIHVVPVLVGGAEMPRPADLPDDLGKLTRRHALILPDLGFHQTIDRLIDALNSKQSETTTESGRPGDHQSDSSGRQASDVRSINLDFESEVSFHISSVPSQRPPVLIAIPCSQGECLVLEFEEDGNKRLLLFDGGTFEDYDALRRSLITRFRKSQKKPIHFDMIFATHLHDSHIGGLRPLMEDSTFSWTKVCINGISPLRESARSVRKFLATARKGSLLEGAYQALEIAALAERSGKKVIALSANGHKIRRSAGLEIVPICPSPPSLKTFSQSLVQLESEAEGHSTLRKVERAMEALGSLALCIFYRGLPVGVLTSDVQESALCSGLTDLKVGYDNLDFSFLQLPSHGYKWSYTNVNSLRAKTYLITGKKNNHDVSLTAHSMEKGSPRIVYAEDYPEIALF